jgi:hypothetical protein
MEQQEQRAVVLLLASDCSEQDVDLAKSSTELTGVESVHLVTSVPPMLLVNLSADMSQDQVDEVVAHFA